jgi:transposase
VKNPEQMTVKQIEISDRLHLPSLHLKTVRAYHLRLAFQDFWKEPRRRAEAFLKKWYYWATHSRLEPIVHVAKTIRHHWSGILNWSETYISNGILEGINSLIQAAKAKARGYRSNRNLIAMAYLIAGKVNLTTLPT